MLLGTFGEQLNNVVCHFPSISTIYHHPFTFSVGNARDVQVEIKVKRKGYMDQVKRFNVRQAIDQQEISSFFDLVKEDLDEE